MRPAARLAVARGRYEVTASVIFITSGLALIRHHGNGSFVEATMTQGFDLKCAPGKTARVWLEGEGGKLVPGQAMVLLHMKEGETEGSRAGYLSPLRQALIDDNERHVNVVVCEADYRALKRGIEHLPPPTQ
jgi:hypothetical protein